MSSGINHTVVCIIMRQIIAGISGIAGIKSELDYLHIGISALLHKTLHRICHKAKILCNNVFLSQSLGNGAEQIHSRSFFPPAALRSLISIRNCIIFIKTAEMIDTDNIIHIKAVRQTLHPPLKACIPVHIPSVQRIAPELSCCGKSIWRASCYLCRLIVLIQLEKSRIRPGICTVHGNIDGNISDNTDTFFVCIGF